MTRTTARRLFWPAATALLASLVALLPSRPARADDADLLASIYTDTGYELRREDRMFALLAAFNVAGFDRSQEARALPFPRRLFHPLRETVRDALLPNAKALRGPIDAFLDAHPADVATYERAAVLLGKPPTYEAGPGFPAALSGLDAVLAKFAKDADLDKLARTTATDYRARLKELRGVVDQPFAKLRAAYRLSEDTAPLLVIDPEPLDAPSAVLATRTADGSHFVMFGLPASGPVDLAPALDAYSRLLASEATAKVAAPGLDALVTKLQAQNILPKEATAASVLAESLRRAVEAKVWATKDPAAYVAGLMSGGYVFTQAFYAALGAPPDAFPAEKGSFAAQVVAGVDLAKVSNLPRPSGGGGRPERRK